jgi:hypothetical protein
MNKEFLIPERNLDALRKKLERLRKKAESKGLAFPTVKPGITYAERSNGGKTVERFQKFHVSWPDITEGKWLLVAKLVHLPEGTVIKNYSGIDLPNFYRNVDPDCDHCQVKRQRIDTFVLRDTTSNNGSTRNGFVQVGRNCMQEFFGATPEKVILQAELITDITDIALAYESLPSLSGSPSIWPLEYYLAFVVEMIREYGWVPRKRAREEGGQATADVAFGAMNEPRAELRKEPSPEAKEEAERAITWAEGLPDDASEFIHNIRTIALSGCVEWRTLGYAASIIYSFRKEMMSEPTGPATNSKFFGVVGERADFFLTVEKIFDSESAWGMTFVHRLRDDNGNIGIWKTTSRLELGKGYHMMARIKEHKNSNGNQETILSHCKVL